jgi:nucleoid DNA-binding protein
MTFEELVDALNAETTLDRTECLAFLHEFMSITKQEVMAGRKQVWLNFGTFSKSVWKERYRRSPKTYQLILCPATNRPKFVATKVLERLVN